MPTRILIADDHRLFREGLKGLLASHEFDVIAEAGDGQDAIRLARKHQPELALVDITMPGLNGVDATREIHRVAPRCKVVVLTMHKDSPYVAAALRAGARGYVLKTQPAAELLKALREVAKGDVYLVPDVSRVLVESYQRNEDVAEDPLSPREREVLQLVAEGKTTKEIGAVLNISFKTAESHRLRIMAKLDIHDTAGLVRYAIRNRLIQA
ncbi:MAG TPA: response regulator transcription factor [Candidatus Eisenbacteria bacterium]|jgi:DNA-binding NarL/FixJ family response regulator